VAIEAGNLAFIMAKEIAAAAGCRVYVLNPSRLAVIYQSMKKTDKEDSLKLAHILEDFREERLPEVAVPSDEEMGRRKLLAGYRREQQSRTRAINRLHGLFLAQGVTTIKKKDLATAPHRQEAVRQLEGFEREEAGHLLQCLELYEARIAALDKRIDGEAAEDEQMRRLQTVPGVGPKVSFAFAAHVAAERFENAAQVSNYLGLVPRVYMSGDTVRYGKITKGERVCPRPAGAGGVGVSEGKAGGEPEVTVRVYDEGKRDEQEEVNSGHSAEAGGTAVHPDEGRGGL